MADAADSTLASGGQFALTVADLNTAVNHEPRIEDVRLAEALGMERPREIRRLIERHREELKRLGAICVTVTQNNDSRGRGRPGRTFWLNKRQALYLCTKSETAFATETTIQMVEVFDAHLAARVAPPPEAAVPPPSTVPFLTGPERLVSSLAVAQALDRRHTGVLRELDVLAAELTDLLGRHVRFATYLHENRRPYRCFHLDRVGFEALMRRLPSADGRVVALRDATLAAFGPPAIEAPSAPGPAAAPSIARDGLALMRIAGETVTVDMLRFEPNEGERTVFITHDGALLLDKAVCHYPSRNWQGRRVGHVLTPLPGGARPRYEAGWVIGTVVDERSARAAGQGERVAPRLPARPKPPRALPSSVASMPPLGAARVQGHA